MSRYTPVRLAKVAGSCLSRVSQTPRLHLETQHATYQAMETSQRLVGTGLDGAASPDEVSDSQQRATYTAHASVFWMAIGEPEYRHLLIDPMVCQLAPFTANVMEKLATFAYRNKRMLGEQAFIYSLEEPACEMVPVLAEIERYTCDPEDSEFLPIGGAKAAIYLAARHVGPRAVDLRREVCDHLLTSEIRNKCPHIYRFGCVMAAFCGDDEPSIAYANQHAGDGFEQIVNLALYTQPSPASNINRQRARLQQAPSAVLDEIAEVDPFYANRIMTYAGARLKSARYGSEGYLTMASVWLAELHALWQSKQDLRVYWDPYQDVCGELDRVRNATKRHSRGLRAKMSLAHHELTSWASSGRLL